MKSFSSGSNLLEELYNLDKYDTKPSDYFHRKKRHVIVLTDTGKPVYSRYGEESDLGPIVATFNVILHKLKNLNGQDSQDIVQKLENPFTKTLIVKHGELYAIVITKNKSDPDILIRKTVDSLLHQILCCLTDNYKRKLEQSSNYNPGNNLEAHYQTLAWVLASSRHSFNSIFTAYMPFPLPLEIRNEVKQSMELYQEEGIFFKMILTRHNIISMDNSDFDLTPQDINALLALVNTKFKIQGVDYINPFCVPSVSPSGYITVYFRFITPQIGVIILFEKPELVPICVQMCEKIEITLEDADLLKTLASYCEQLPLEPEKLVEKSALENVVAYNF